MTFPLTYIAAGRCVRFSDLLLFVRGASCPKGVIDPSSDDPLVPNWYVDEIVAAFFAHGGRRLSTEEICKQTRGPASHTG
jgi:hypothetical protein